MYACEVYFASFQELVHTMAAGLDKMAAAPGKEYLQRQVEVRERATHSSLQFENKRNREECCVRCLFAHKDSASKAFYMCCCETRGICGAPSMQQSEANLMYCTI